MAELLTELQLAELRETLATLPSVESTMQMLLKQLRLHGAIPKLIDEIERQREEIANHEANLAEYRQMHQRAWHLIDGLSEDLGDHNPIAHPELVERAATFLEMYPLRMSGGES